MCIDKLCADIESAYQKSISSHRTFHEMIRKLMKQQNWNSTIFYEKTELNKKIYSDLKRPDYTPTMRIIVSICVGLKTDIHTADTLLAAAGLAFSPTNRVHMAYRKLIDLCSLFKLGIEDCNEILRKLNIERKHDLGSLSRDE